MSRTETGCSGIPQACVTFCGVTSQLKSQRSGKLLVFDVTAAVGDLSCELGLVSRRLTKSENQEQH